MKKSKKDETDDVAKGPVATLTVFGAVPKIEFATAGGVV